MKTLEEHDAERRRHFFNNDPSPRRNGIACPKCGAELFDTQPMVTLTSAPPQKETHCENPMCDYKGLRVA